MSIPPLYDESDYEALREEKDKRIAELEAAIEAWDTEPEEKIDALRQRAEQAEAALEERDTAHKALVNDLQASSVWSNQWADYCVPVTKIGEALRRYNKARAEGGSES